MKLLKNALVWDKKTKKEKIVNVIYDNKIRNISSRTITDNFAETVDLKGKILLPGCIDAHVHFNDPGFTNRENFASGTLAAAFGGITTIIDMPCTSIPPVTNKKNLYKKLSKIKAKAYIDYALWGGIRSEDFPLNKAMIQELWKAGVVGFKIYVISGMDDFSDLSYQQIKEVFEKFPHILFAFHAEDKEIIQTAEKSFTNEQKRKAETYVKIRSTKAEYQAVKNIIPLATNNHIHFVHISSKKASELILKNKESCDITFETCPHFLQFTAADYDNLPGRLKTAPPVKTENDRDFLRMLVKDGKIDFIATDHAGCDFKTEKKKEDFSKIYSGIPGTELMIPYLFSEFYHKEKVSLGKLIKLTSENPAKRYGLYPMKGSLKIGTDADFTILQKDDYFVDEQKLHSLGKYSPFHNRKFNYRIDSTIIRGNRVISDGEIQVKPGFGNWLKRK